MELKNVKQPITAVDFEDFPEASLPEFLFMGRSNVGKSTLINTLCRRKNLAHTSSSPGKTQTLNFYEADKRFYIVDAPGYGYAKVSKKKQSLFGIMLERYLLKRPTLRHVFLLVDFRHPPTDDDLLMAEFYMHYNIPFTIVATKTDKVSKNKRHKHLSVIKEDLALREKDEVVLFSKNDADSKERLLQIIESLL